MLHETADAGGGSRDYSGLSYAVLRKECAERKLLKREHTKKEQFVLLLRMDDEAKTAAGTVQGVTSHTPEDKSHSEAELPDEEHEEAGNPDEEHEKEWQAEFVIPLNFEASRV